MIDYNDGNIDIYKYIDNYISDLSIQADSELLTRFSTLTAIRIDTLTTSKCIIY